MRFSLMTVVVLLAQMDLVEAMSENGHDVELRTRGHHSKGGEKE